MSPAVMKADRLESDTYGVVTCADQGAPPSNIHNAIYYVTSDAHDETVMAVTEELKP